MQAVTAEQQLLEDACHYANKGQYPDHVTTKNYKRSIRRKAGKLVCKDGKTFCRKKAGKLVSKDGKTCKRQNKEASS